MIGRFLVWCGVYATPIAYTIGVLNIVSGAIHIYDGHPIFGVFWIAFGGLIIYYEKMK